MKEGVIKFNLVQAQLRSLYFPPEIKKGLQELTAWRQRLFELDLIGCDLSRYGACYGNVSMRYLPQHSLEYTPTKPKGQRAFLISGTQTGKLETLTEQEYVRVFRYDLSHNQVFAEGAIKPSSEALTHGSIYDIDPTIQVVLHAHTHTLWKKAKTLRLPTTSERVEYGTPQMAQEVQRLYRESYLPLKKIVIMGGHEDGVISFGHDAEEAGTILLRFFDQAKRI